MKRLEFSKPVKIEMFRRAGGPDDLRCEGCGLRLMGKPFEYHHLVPEWVRTQERAQRKPLTAEDGKVLGTKCCHQDISAKDNTDRAHGVRIIEKAAGVKKASRPIPGSRASGWRKPMTGPAERRS